MIRGRKPMAIQHAIGNPRVVTEFVEAYDTHSYVAAPIMPEGRVIGFLHADHRLKPRRVDEFDRDSLWAFAEGFGYVVERGPTCRSGCARKVRNYDGCCSGRMRSSPSISTRKSNS